LRDLNMVLEKDVALEELITETKVLLFRWGSKTETADWAYAGNFVILPIIAPNPSRPQSKIILTSWFWSTLIGRRKSKMTSVIFNLGFTCRQSLGPSTTVLTKSISTFSRLLNLDGSTGTLSYERPKVLLAI
jgi:hypothetical protein